MLFALRSSFFDLIDNFTRSWLVISIDHNESFLLNLLFMMLLQKLFFKLLVLLLLDLFLHQFVLIDLILSGLQLYCVCSLRCTDVAYRIEVTSDLVASARNIHG